MRLIDGKALAARIRAEIKGEIAAAGLVPKLAVLLVGDDPASHIYVNLKEKAAIEAGIALDIRRLPADTPDDELTRIIDAWNRDTDVDAILIQLPLPTGHDADALVSAVDPDKDADGFHPINLRALADGSGRIIPPVHEGILRLIAETDVAPNGSRAVVIANSATFAEPLVHLLKKAGALVEVFTPDDLHRDTVRQAKIVVVAVGRAKFLTRDLVSDGACVIDVGTNKNSDGKIVGDADTDGLKDADGWLSPVPGGVGPMTIAMLLKNVVGLAKRRRVIDM